MTSLCICSFSDAFTFPSISLQQQTAEQEHHCPLSSQRALKPSVEKKKQILQQDLFQLLSSPFIAKKPQPTTKAPRSLLSDPWPPVKKMLFHAAGVIKCSVLAAASPQHRDSSAASIHQHHLPSICLLPATEKVEAS